MALSWSDERLIKDAAENLNGIANAIDKIARVQAYRSGLLSKEEARIGFIEDVQEDANTPV